MSSLQKNRLSTLHGRGTKMLPPDFFISHSCLVNNNEHIGRDIRFVLSLQNQNVRFQVFTLSHDRKRNSEMFVARVTLPHQHRLAPTSTNGGLLFGLIVPWDLIHIYNIFDLDFVRIYQFLALLNKSLASLRYILWDPMVCSVPSRP